MSQGDKMKWVLEYYLSRFPEEVESLKLQQKFWGKLSTFLQGVNNVVYLHFTNG